MQHQMLIGVSTNGSRDTLGVLFVLMLTRNQTILNLGLKNAPFIATNDNVT